MLCVDWESVGRSVVWAHQPTVFSERETINLYPLSTLHRPFCESIIAGSYTLIVQLFKSLQFGTNVASLWYSNLARSFAAVDRLVMPCPLQYNCLNLRHAGELLYVCIRDLSNSISAIQR